MSTSQCKTPMEWASYDILSTSVTYIHGILSNMMKITITVIVDINVFQLTVPLGKTTVKYHPVRINRKNMLHVAYKQDVT